MVYRCLAVLAVCVLWPVNALAQITDFGDFARAETRFGVLEVRDSGYPRQLLFNGQPTGIEDAIISIMGAYAYPGEAADWVLIQQAHGGNMCPSTYRVLRIDAASVRVTGAMGDCLHGLQTLRILPGRIELDIAEPDLRLSHRVYGWSGRADDPVQETQVAAAVGQGPVLTAQEAVGLIGQHPGAVLGDPRVQALFAQQIPVPALEELRQRVDVADSISATQGWVFGQGCMAHQCNQSWGIWGIRLADMGVAIMLFDRGATARPFGSRAAMADPVWINTSMVAASK